MKWIIPIFMALSVHASEAPVDFYTENIQPIFDNRCVACHSCLNAPCQLNLQSYEGFQRGASKINVYNGTRIDAVPPTRLGIDAHTSKDWLNKGFYPVNTSKDPSQNLFFQSIAIKASEKKAPSNIVSSSQLCPKTISDPRLAMPYALPGLNQGQIQALESWIRNGAPGPKHDSLKVRLSSSKEVKKQIQEWEDFLNQTDLRHRLVSRYLYEHLFLAHLYFSSEPKQFFRLIRSSSPCQKSLTEIATRRPNDNPGTDRFFYCLKPQTITLVAKTHIPFELNPLKLKRYNELFFSENWKLTRLSTYNYQEAENPFRAFSEIPVKARYQFLLDDAYYHISTFIKGPVCNGSAAVNSIQEQFYVFFISPESELMARSRGFYEKSESTLILPGVWGSDIKLENTPAFLADLTQKREEYRSLRARWKKELFPKGYALTDIWDGNGHNSNAFLTVLRHDDNAMVMKGAVGDLSKTAFVLDYSLFERLVYNLVVNFDVYGNIGHQYLTRIYMDMIRMEAEEIFLSMLPPKDRVPTRQSWYQGFATELKMQYMFPFMNPDLPTAIDYSKKKNSKRELIEKILFTHLNDKTRGPVDSINWKTIEVPEHLSQISPLTAVEQDLKKIASLKATDYHPFARHFPELAILLLKEKNGQSKVYSLVHHREHQNISWIFAESLRLLPKDDSLTLREGVLGHYPNMFFVVAEDQTKSFTRQVFNIKSAKDYQKLVETFGVSRNKKNFWEIYDEIHHRFRSNNPVDFGYLDLTRYEI